jgi:hypothetical protein
MFYEDMTETQRLEEKLFVIKLSQAGWDAETVSGILHGGVLINPEGNAFLERVDASLALEYYAEESILILAITEKATDSLIRLKIKYGSQFLKVVDWVVANQKILTSQSFARLLKDVYPLCHQILLIGEDNLMYEILQPRDFDNLQCGR